MTRSGIAAQETWRHAKAEAPEEAKRLAQVIRTATAEAHVQHQLAQLREREDADHLRQIHALLWEKYPNNLERTELVLRLAAQAHQAGLSLHSVLAQISTW